jgi:NADPH:quinone reductase-like Zn-dependent oxidoreductase
MIERRRRNNMLMPLNGFVIIKDLKEQNDGGLIKPQDLLQENKFVGTVVEIDDQYNVVKVGDLVVYDGSNSVEVPKIKGKIDEDLVIVHYKDILIKII